MTSYLESHTAPEKGLDYERAYATDPVLRYFWAQEQAVLARILTEFYADTPVDLLDFACGTGRIAGALEARVERATGIDVSESMLEVARTKLQRTDLISGNLLDEPVLQGRTFNLITAFRFFANAETDLRRGALRALEPLLTGDGCLVFNNHQNTAAMYSVIGRWYASARGRAAPRTLSLEACEELLADVGLEIVRIYPIGLLHIPRIPLPSSFYRTADRIASWSRLLTAHSESPIVVARRRQRP